MTKIQEKATLVSLTIRRWMNQTNDRTAAEQVDQINHANKAGKFLKDLVPPELLKPIVSAASALRSNHYIYTINWGDNGERLLPGKLMFEFTTKHKGLVAQFDNAVEDFLLKYPAAKASAPARLGALYDIRDYPSVDKLREKFNVELNWTLIPDAKDFRVTAIEDGLAEEIRNEIEESVTRRQRDAVRNCWARMKECVEKIHERLADETAVFRDSLIENARIQARLITDLNLTGDEEIETARQELEALLAPPQRLRDDKSLRFDRAEKARKLLEKMGAFA